MMKRLVDVSLALVGLIVLLPLLVLVALMIKLDSDGPVFFRQERVGLQGRRFRIFKFRTMIVGADRMGARLTVRRDPRVTRVGQLLRWFKVDELPQLLNVFTGDMSLIGPRPEDPHFVASYAPEHLEVLSVRPGIIGVSQIFGRDETESYPEGLKDTEAYYVQHILPEKLARDLAYVRSCSLSGDMALLARGLWVTLLGAVKSRFLWRSRKRVVLFGLDCALIALAYSLGYLIRMDFVLPPRISFLVLPLMIMLAVRVTALLYFGAYQGVFAYFGLWDLIAVFKAVSLSAVVGAGFTFFVGLQSYPRSAFLIDWALALFFLSALRYGLRGWVRQRARRRGDKRKKALIVGAGAGGEQVVRMLLEDPFSPYRPVGFIDESPERWGALIHGVRVFGAAAEIPLALSANDIKTVFVCLSDLSEATARDVVEMCDQAHAEYRVVPTLTDLLSAETFARNGHPTRELQRAEHGNGVHAAKEGVF